MTWNCLALLGHTCNGNEVTYPLLGWLSCRGYDLKLPCPFWAHIIFILFLVAAQGDWACPNILPPAKNTDLVFELLHRVAGHAQI
jgi:hypothetical protein